MWTMFTAGTLSAETTTRWTTTGTARTLPGIVAMENNAVGGVGVAYNSKVMVLKAGNSSGYFNNSDIAEAIQYAYMNGRIGHQYVLRRLDDFMAVEEALRWRTTPACWLPRRGMLDCAISPVALVILMHALPIRRRCLMSLVL